jgi:glutathione peroxidase
MNNTVTLRFVLGACLGLLASASQAQSCSKLLDRNVPRLQDEKPQSLCQYAGKVVLVVNTASQCGFTPQYQGLEALYEKYRERGLVVLGFPSNDFGGQEPDSNQEIAKFCEDNFSVKFPMFIKAPVSGKDAQPLYVDLKARTGSVPRWNFHKYLIARDGSTVQSYTSLTGPSDKSLTREIEQLLAAR